jgi:hypothetical protein
VQHWYIILDKELKTLVRNKALWLEEPPTLKFVFETSERIEINLLEKKAAMGFLKHEEKPQEKVKAAKASLSSHAADTSTTCFKCGKPGYLRKKGKEVRATLLRAEDIALDVVPKGIVSRIICGAGRPPARYAR